MDAKYNNSVSLKNHFQTIGEKKLDFIRPTSRAKANETISYLTSQSPYLKKKGVI